METKIGSLIKEYLYREHLSIKELSVRTGLSKESIYIYLRRNDMPVSLLYRISKAVNHNFFQYLTPVSGDTASTGDRATLKGENALLGQRIALLEQENAYLKQINRLLEGKSITNYENLPECEAPGRV